MESGEALCSQLEELERLKAILREEEHKREEWERLRLSLSQEAHAKNNSSNSQSKRKTPCAPSPSNSQSNLMKVMETPSPRTRKRGAEEMQKGPIQSVSKSQPLQQWLELKLPVPDVHTIRFAEVGVSVCVWMWIR